MGVLDYSTGAPPIWVITDVSKVGTSAVLCQGDNWRTATPIAFTSSMLNAAERNYPVHEQELLAIHHALQRWRHYLLGVSFRVLSDHQSLRDLKMSYIKKFFKTWAPVRPTRETYACDIYCRSQS